MMLNQSDFQFTKQQQFIICCFSLHVLEILQVKATCFLVLEYFQVKELGNLTVFYCQNFMNSIPGNSKKASPSYISLEPEFAGTSTFAEVGGLNITLPPSDTVQCVLKYHPFNLIPKSQCVKHTIIVTLQPYSINHALIFDVHQVLSHAPEVG